MDLFFFFRQSCPFPSRRCRCLFSQILNPDRENHLQTFLFSSMRVCLAVLWNGARNLRTLLYSVGTWNADARPWRGGHMKNGRGGEEYPENVDEKGIWRGVSQGGVKFPPGALSMVATSSIRCCQPIKGKLQGRKVVGGFAHPFPSPTPRPPSPWGANIVTRVLFLLYSVGLDIPALFYN